MGRMFCVVVAGLVEADATEADDDVTVDSDVLERAHERDAESDTRETDVEEPNSVDKD